MPAALHCHSWYSILEGASSPQALVDHAVAGGWTALALTDANNLYGAIAFADIALRQGVRPLLGACLRQQRTRCVALVADRSGYRSLCQILSRLHLQAGPPGSAATEPPCTLVNLLCDHPEGLHLLVDDVVLAERLHPLFGPRLWSEIVRPRDPKHEAQLLECGRRLGLRSVASSAAHFATPEDYPTFRAAAAVRQRTLLDRLPTTLTITPAHHLPTVAQMRQRFHDLPEALTGADALADLLAAEVVPRDLVLPSARLPPGVEAIGRLRTLCETGLRRRDLGANLAARERLRGELAVLETAGLSGYFLVVRDIARYARSRGHRMALRGSAGNSLVCYLIGITDVDPIRFGLEPERFLHPGRTDLPDIDLDFDWRVRDEVIAHTIRRYGAAHAAQISTHQFLQPRSAFREAGRIHGLADDQISTLLTSLEATVDTLVVDKETPEPTAVLPRLFPLEPERWPRLLADARRLLGRPHHLSIHPGGVVLTPDPLADHVPLQWAAKGVVVTQLDKDGVEAVGLVKIDLLGNRALATVEEGFRHIRKRACLGERRGVSPTWYSLPRRAYASTLAKTSADDDPATVDLLRRGDTVGVNQLESPAMRHLLIQMRPRGLGDVIQSLALVRPGAAGAGVKERFVRRRLGLEPAVPLHPRLAGLLGETKGMLLYEDDALHVLRALTGLDAPDADRLRKRISKSRTPQEGEALRQEFLAHCGRAGVSPEAVGELWTQLAKFNHYAFCKSHAVSYGLIAWDAVWLKAHHPAAFWTAALNNNQSAYPHRVYIEAIKRAGLEIRPPCIAHSEDVFTLEEGALRVGLGAIAGLPLELRERLLAERTASGPFRDLADLRRRVAPGPEALALLIRCGALDTFGRRRPALFLDAELQDLARSGSAELFDAAPVEWAPEDYDKRRQLIDEWTLLGFILGPPLFRLFRSPDAVLPPGPRLISSREVPDYLGRLVRVQGLVATGRHVFTADGRSLQFVTLEDEEGLADVTLFPNTCPQVPYMTMGPWLATGIVEEQYGVFTLTARTFERMDSVSTIS